MNSKIITKGNINLQKGVTLIALVITIIVLLILAGVTLNMVLGEEGIISQAQTAGLENRGGTVEELKNLWQTEDKLKNKYGVEGNVQTLEELLQDLVDKELITEDEREEINETGQVTIGSRTIKFTVKRPTQGSITDIYDSTGEADGLHIGDFINYDAGTWTDDDITAIANTGSKQPVSTGKPTNDYQFGRFASGDSRNESVATNYTTYSYVKDESGNAVKGWRIFDIEGDTVTLISAGCTEGFKYTQSSNSEIESAYIAEYIFTGNVNSSANASKLGLGTTYTKRDFSMYEQGIGTNARTITRAMLDDWYTKYMEIENADTHTKDTFRTIYGTKYESLIDNYAHYWLSTALEGYKWDLSCVNPSWREAASRSMSTNDYYGIRILVDIPASVICTLEGTKTITSRDVDYTYNVWDINEE